MLRKEIVINNRLSAEKNFVMKLRNEKKVPPEVIAQLSRNFYFKFGSETNVLNF